MSIITPPHYKKAEGVSTCAGARAPRFARRCEHIPAKTQAASEREKAAQSLTETLYRDFGALGGLVGENSAQSTARLGAR